MVATCPVLLASPRHFRHRTSKEHDMTAASHATAQQFQPQAQSGTPQTPQTSQPGALAAVKAKQQAAWSSGDYSVVGTTLQIVGEGLCEAIDLRSDERVLDVACGNGNAALAAARRFAHVTGVDYVPALLARAASRAAADGVTLDLREGDAEALPFHDGAFDVVLSTFGVMFAPDQELAARELLRVCRHGGRIGLANWTPDGFVGQMFKVVGAHVPPPPGLRGPALWGTEGRLAELFGTESREIRAQTREFTFRYRSTAHWLEVFRSWYGPVHRAFAALPPEGQAALAAELGAVIERFNVAHDGTVVVPGAYLEAVITRT
jgi:ubiquinone/menaquinone biosynthesis C-methylase UbiE